MKKLKKQIKAEEKRILEEDKDFLEEVIYPIIDSNAAAQKSKRTNRKLYLAIPAACVLILAFSIIGYYLFKNDEPYYTTAYEVKKSDITYLNSTLKVTKLLGDYDDISLTYEVHTEKPAYFALTVEEERETSYSTCTLNVVVDKDYPYRDNRLFMDQMSFMDFIIDINVSSSTESGEDGEVFIHEITARLDTGVEKYYFDYFELSLDSFSRFTDWIENILIKK